MSRVCRDSATLWWYSDHVMLTFEEFKAWFATFDSTLAGKAPSLPQWWELKARLDAVGPTASPADVEKPSRSAALPTAPPATPAPQADIDVVDAADDSGVLQPREAWGGPTEADDLPPSEFTVYEEAVQLLKKPGRHSRARP